MTNNNKKGNLIKHLSKNEQNFTILNNEFIIGKDPPIQLEVLGAIWKIKSLPEDWDFNQRGFAKTCGCSIGKVGKIMKTLEKLGYMKVKEIRNKNGQFKSYEYHFYETLNPELLKETNEEVSNIPDTEKPENEYPNTENKDSNKEYINKESNNKKSKDFINKSETVVSVSSNNSKEVNSTKGISIHEKKEQNIKKLTEMARNYTNNPELSESLDDFIALIARVDSRNLNEQTFKSNLKLLSVYQLAEQIEIVEKALRTNKPYLSKPYNSAKITNTVKSVSPKIRKTQSKRYIPNIQINNEKEDL